MKLLLATTNAGKVREQQKALQSCPVEVVTLSEWPKIQPPEEPGPTFAINAACKAFFYQRSTKVAALGEDSGLVIDALDGEPGVNSARWLGTNTSYVLKNQEILKRLKGLPANERSARYVCALALAVNGKVVFSTEGVCSGRIALEPHGDGGFGYDPIFYYPPLKKTMGTLSLQEKNVISHRGKAMAELVKFLSAL